MNYGRIVNQLCAVLRFNRCEATFTEVRLLFAAQPSLIIFFDIKVEALLG